MMNIPEYLVWIDCEMTGLDPEKDCLVEIAVVITDIQLNVVDKGLDLVIKPRPESLAGMDDYVRNMHTTSGLINEFDNGLELKDAEAQALDYIKKYVPTAKLSPLAGNTIGTDRMFISRYMPDLDGHLHYRNIDVSTIKELAKRWFPKAYFQAPKKVGGHRALADILESIDELRHYRQSVFVAEFQAPAVVTEGSSPAAED
ncbi:MAG: oligoribonuclease [Rhodoluna sp.]|jgi:oligoribonuclease